MESLRGNNDSASRLFETAILYAGRRGLIQDRAVVSELYGEHLKRLGQDYAQDAEFQLSEALKLYEEWGARAKVKQMQKTFGILLSPPSEIEVATD